jgi:hypothetical protein
MHTREKEISFSFTCYSGKSQDRLELSVGRDWVETQMQPWMQPLSLCRFDRPLGLLVMWTDRGDGAV